MDGILLVNKPVGITSRDVVNQVCKKFNTKKVGHTGTLDPFADGLMVLTIGKGTKAGQFLEEQTKCYVATLALGSKTDTMDCDGTIIDNKEVPFLSLDIIQEVIGKYLGDIIQTVPLYSAIKINGKKLYEYARSGESIECPSRKVHIFAIDVLGFDKTSIKFRVRCSKGTYIRVLGNDIAESLGTYGHLIDLKRIEVGQFLLKDSYTMNDITENDIISVHQALSKSMDIVIVDQTNAINVMNGKCLYIEGHSDIIYVANENQSPIAVMKKESPNIYRVLRGLF